MVFFRLFLHIMLVGSLFLLVPSCKPSPEQKTGSSVLGVKGFVSYDECYATLKKLYPENDVRKDKHIIKGVLPSITMEGYVMNYEVLCKFHFSKDQVFDDCQCLVKSNDFWTFLEMFNREYGNAVHADTLGTSGQSYVYEWFKEDLKVQLFFRRNTKEIHITYDFIDSAEFNDRF